MPPRHHPRTLHDQASWRILRRRARLSGKTIEELLEEERRAEGLTIEPASAMPPTAGAMAPADIECLSDRLVPIISQGIRSDITAEVRQILVRLSQDTSQATTIFARELFRWLEAQGVTFSAEKRAEIEKLILEFDLKRESIFPKLSGGENAVVPETDQQPGDLRMQEG